MQQKSKKTKIGSLIFIAKNVQYTYILFNGKWRTNNERKIAAKFQNCQLTCHKHAQTMCWNRVGEKTRNKCKWNRTTKLLCKRLLPFSFTFHFIFRCELAIIRKFWACAHTHFQHKFHAYYILTQIKMQFLIALKFMAPKRRKSVKIVNREKSALSWLKREFEGLIIFLNWLKWRYYRCYWVCCVCHLL